MTRAARYAPEPASRALATTLAADGSLVVPPEFLADLGWAAGDELIIESDGDSLLVRPLDVGDDRTRPG